MQQEDFDDVAARLVALAVLWSRPAVGVESARVIPTRHPRGEKPVQASEMALLGIPEAGTGRRMDKPLEVREDGRVMVRGYCRNKGRDWSDWSQPANE